MCAGLPASQRRPGPFCSLRASTGLPTIARVGALEVCRGDARVSVLTEPGAMVGECRSCCEAAHGDQCEALGEAQVIEIENAETFFRAHPDLSWHIARVLANQQRRSPYLVDIGRASTGATAAPVDGRRRSGNAAAPAGAPVRPGSRRDPRLLSGNRVEPFPAGRTTRAGTDERRIETDGLRAIADIQTASPIFDC